MLLVAACYAVFAIFSGAAVSVPMLLIGRFLLGLTIGVSVVVVPVFVAESAPAKVRGALLVLYQVATVVGIILGYLVAYALAGSENWRWMLGLAAVPAAAIFMLLLRLPDTARWYMLKGRRAEAESVLSSIEPDADVEAELDDIERALQEEHGGALDEMLNPPYRRATVFVIGLGFFIQITGINAIVYYSPRIFEAMGFEGNFSLLILPALVQVGALAAVIVSLTQVDRRGPTAHTAHGHRHDDLRQRPAHRGVPRRRGLRRRADRPRLPRHPPLHVGFTFGFGALVWV